MKRTTAAVAIALTLTLAAAGLQAQVESHALPPTWPFQLLPPAVGDLPKASCRELSAPLAPEAAPKPAVDPALKPAGGDAKAAVLADMLAEPKKVIELAQAGKWAEAVEAGRPLMQKSKEAYADFTWDYLANALAWAMIQTDRVTDAANVHRQVGNLLDDEDLKKYHRLAAVAIGQVADGKAPPLKDGVKVTPEKLKEADTLRAVVRASLSEDLVQFKKCVELIPKGTTPLGRMNAIRAAYAKLRYMKAVEPGLPGELAALLRAAADTLITDAAVKALENTGADQRRMAQALKAEMRIKDAPVWNDQVTALWTKIGEIKRLCRVHDYLRRLGLAGAANATEAFDKSHEMLYALGHPGQVYKTFGARDLRRRGPYEDVFGFQAEDNRPALPPDASSPPLP